jgi:hypothetical protein
VENKHTTEIRTWDEFRKWILENFEPKQAEADLYKRFINRSQRSGESVADYFRHLQEASLDL